MCNTTTLSESTTFVFLEALSLQSQKDNSTINDNGSTFECLDHQYFVAEIAKLINIRNDIELDRFHRRISN